MDAIALVLIGSGLVYLAIGHFQHREAITLLQKQVLDLEVANIDLLIALGSLGSPAAEHVVTSEERAISRAEIIDELRRRTESDEPER